MGLDAYAGVLVLKNKPAKEVDIEMRPLNERICVARLVSDTDPTSVRNESFTVDEDTDPGELATANCPDGYHVDDITAGEPDGNPDYVSHEEHCYWRKCRQLQGWMQELYDEKGGATKDFNVATLLLNSKDIDSLELAISDGTLAGRDDRGFFWGGLPLGRGRRVPNQDLHSCCPRGTG